MTLKGGTNQACAACKYQRRKCTPDCALAPYFPADQPKKFQNAHRLFGVSNILKILKQIDPSQKMIAMHTIIYESNVRDRNPVHGCLGVTYELHKQIYHAQEELHAVQTQLAFYRHHQISSSNDSKNALNLFNQTDYTALPMNSNHSYTNYGSPSIDADYNTNASDNNLMWLQQQGGGGEGGYFNGTNNNSDHDNSIAMQCQFQQLSVEEDQKPKVEEEYDEIHPFFDIIDDSRQSYIDTKDAYESSSESSFKDTTQSLELTLLGAN